MLNQTERDQVEKKKMQALITQAKDAIKNDKSDREVHKLVKPILSNPEKI
jgi:hypothetical protein